MDLQTIDELIEENAFFRGLPKADLKLLAGCGRNVHIGGGEALLREGDEAATFYVIREGRASIEVYVPNRGPLVIDTVGPGEIVGVSWLFPPYRWQFDARALEPIRAVAFDGGCIRGKSEEDPRLGFELMKRVASILQRRLRSARIRLLDLYGDGRA